MNLDRESYHGALIDVLTCICGLELPQLDQTCLVSHEHTMSSAVMVSRGAGLHLCSRASAARPDMSGKS